jgi:hypothetical protein
MGLSMLFAVQQTTIRCGNGSEFYFVGLHRNVTKIKSFEGVDRVWVEEAQSVSKESWDVLVPTIRKEGSEIWISFNPELEEDEVYQRFILNKPSNAIVQKVNWYDNPWFPDTLRREKDDLRDRDLDAYMTVWEGECVRRVIGAFWTHDMLDRYRMPAPRTPDERVALMNQMKRVVVAVDPSGCAGPDDERSDEIGIVVAGLDKDGYGYVLEDLSGRYAPEGWARTAVSALDNWKADRIVAEQNFGGAMVSHTIQTVRRTAPVKLIQASRGKAVRAEPIAALYEQGKVKHVGNFPQIERQLCMFSAAGYQGARSPDRADALVWAMTEIMEPQPEPARRVHIPFMSR